MFELTFLGVPIIVLIGAFCYILGRKKGASYYKDPVIVPPVPPIYVTAPLDPRVNQIIETINAMPEKVLQSITSSTNHQKGRLGELIGYLNLNSKYDRLIALRDITDFLAIRFTKNGIEGSIDFIDCKNGPNARLTKDQMQVRDLIKNGKVNFFSFKIETNTASDPD